MKNAIQEESKIRRLNERMTRAKNDIEKADLSSAIEMLSIFEDTLALLEFSLGELASEAGLPTLVRELKSDCRKFLSSVSVATLACFFRDRGSLHLFPRFNLRDRVKTLDLSVNLGRQVWIEVTTPGPANVLFEGEATSAPLPERAPGQLRDEYRDNFEPILAAGFLRNEPLLIAIDGHWTEIDDTEVWIAVEGRRPRDPRQNNESDLFVNYPGTERTSGVIIYKRAKVVEGRMQLSGTYLRNPRATTPLTASEVSRLKSEQRTQTG